MKKLITILFIVGMSCAFVKAQSHSKKNAVASVAKLVASAFSAGDLKKLDSRHLLDGYLNLTIEYTAGDVEFEYKAFRSFAGLGKWLKNQEHDGGFPFRVNWPLTGCRDGICTFFLDGGILHNHVYFTKLHYSYKNKRLYIKSVRLMYG